MEVKMWKKFKGKWQTEYKEKKRMRIIYVMCFIILFLFIMRHYFGADI